MTSTAPLPNSTADFRQVSAYHHFDFSSTLSEVARIVESVRTLLTEQYDDETVDLVELALAEALNNIVIHGYQDRPGAIAVELQCEKKNIVIEVVDYGNPIPAHLLDPNNIGAAEDGCDQLSIPESGQGLRLIFTIMDSVRYESSVVGNHLFLVRQVAPNLSS